MLAHTFLQEYSTTFVHFPCFLYFCGIFSLYSVHFDCIWTFDSRLYFYNKQFNKNNATIKIQQRIQQKSLEIVLKVIDDGLALALALWLRSWSTTTPTVPTPSSASSSSSSSLVTPGLTGGSMPDARAVLLRTFPGLVGG
ncbi:MAG: hypothetical protein GY833_04915 [Aestuariibacter sp.]|nr:hypothetical protein [Aestuariibacter sp.]